MESKKIRCIKFHSCMGKATTTIRKPLIGTLGSVTLQNHQDSIETVTIARGTILRTGILSVT